MDVRLQALSKGTLLADAAMKKAPEGAFFIGGACVTQAPGREAAQAFLRRTRPATPRPRAIRAIEVGSGTALAAALYSTT